MANHLLAACQNKGVFDVPGEDGPLTGIGRVRLANLLEAYRDKVDAATDG